MPLLDNIWYADHRDPTVHRTPVLMIHGAGGSHLDWPAELRRMPEANAIIPDLPGHGRSEAPGHKTVGAYAADMVALLNALELQNVIVLGFSMGGAIAQMLALYHRQRISGMILIATAAKMPVDPALLAALNTDYEKAIPTLIERQWSQSADEQMKRLSLRRLREVDPDVLRGDYQAVNAFDNRDRLSQLQIPTLIIAGTADQIIPLEDSQYLHEQITGSQLVKIEGGGHLVTLEQPQAVASAVQAWLVEQDS